LRLYFVEPALIRTARERPARLFDNSREKATARYNSKWRAVAQALFPPPGSVTWRRGAGYEMATERNTSQTRTPISRLWRSINAVHRLREGGATNPQTFCDGTNRFRVTSQ
jgi:hypothetical protein